MERAIERVYPHDAVVSPFISQSDRQRVPALAWHARLRVPLFLRGAGETPRSATKMSASRQRLWMTAWSCYGRSCWKRRVRTDMERRVRSIVIK